MKTAEIRASCLAKCENHPAISAGRINEFEKAKRVTAPPAVRGGDRKTQRKVGQGVTRAEPAGVRDGPTAADPAKQKGRQIASPFVMILAKGRCRPIVSIPVLLHAGRPEAGKSVPINGTLPGEELLNRQRIALACFVQRQQSTANGGDDLRLAANDPSTRCHRRKVGDRKRRPVWANNIFDSYTCSVGHCTLTLNMTTLTMTVAIRL